MAKQTKISLSVDQIQAINSILGGKSKEEAAREADVHVDKIEDWLETDAPFLPPQPQADTTSRLEPLASEHHKNLIVSSWPLDGVNIR